VSKWLNKNMAIKAGVIWVNLRRFYLVLFWTPHRTLMLSFLAVLRDQNQSLRLSDIYSKFA